MTDTHFGFETIDEQQKPGRVHGVFHSVAKRYDLMNDVMSAGIHRLWKQAMIDMLAPRPGMRLLDVAGGTGDIAARFLDRLQGKGHVTICDFTPAMLQQGRTDKQGFAYNDHITWVGGDAMQLPFADASFDAYTIAFGMRNVTRIQEALVEAFRVLRPGGRFLCLEFSQMTTPIMQKLYDLYSFNIIPKMGKMITGDRASYQYLVESIRQFPTAKAYQTMIEQAGFSRTSTRIMSSGIVAIHSGWRI